MKKFIKEHRNIVIIIVSVLLVLLIIIAIILATKGHKNLKKMPNEYIIQEREVELPGTKVVSNDNLNSEQCLDGICVSNVVIHSTTDQGRVECTITNKSDNNIYTLSGQRINSTKQLKHGIYIINKKKVIY